MNKIVILSLLFIISSVLSGCGSRGQLITANLTKVSYSELPSWNGDTHIGAYNAFMASCNVINRRKDDKNMSVRSQINGKSFYWKKICNDGLNSNISTNAQAKKFFEKWFIPYKIRDRQNNERGIITGYYTIKLNCSLIKHGPYTYPVYYPPKNLQQLKGSRILTHTSINNGALKNKKLEIAWCDNISRIYFMHLQGSGVLNLKEGGEIQLVYGGRNGHPYRPIHHHLQKYGAGRLDTNIDIMRWMERNSYFSKRLIEENPSYVFFKKNHLKGVYGSMNVRLISNRSIAVDTYLYPLGTPFWIETNMPKTKYLKNRKVSRLMIAHDRGGGVIGALRADWYFGEGVYAEDLASSMRTSSAFFILFPKAIKLARSYSYTR